MTTAKRKRPSPYGSKKFVSIDEYHSAFSLEIRKLLDDVRAAIRSAAPAAVETISYNMPAFRQRTNLVYYAAFKDHISLFPSGSPLTVFKEELAKYKTSKGTIQFPLDRPIPKALIKRIVKHRVLEDAQKELAK